MTETRRIAVLGSTGSIGTQALDLVRRNPQRFVVAALSAGGSDVSLLADQVAEFAVPLVGVLHPDRAEALEAELASPDGANVAARPTAHDQHLGSDLGHLTPL